MVRSRFGRMGRCARCAIMGLIAISPARAQWTPLPEPPPPQPITPPMSLTEDLTKQELLTRRPSPAPPSATGRPAAAARCEGVPEPGQVVTLSADGSAGQSLSFRWVQLQGPAVALDQPTGKTARFTYPSAAEPLRFLLVAGNREGVDTAIVNVGGSSQTETAHGLKADAGDDQVGLAGHLITFNGGASEPRGRVGFRWIQVAGAPVATIQQNGPFASVVPASPGHYRFALVVASEGEISLPDTVDLYVGTADGQPAASAGTISPVADRETEVLARTAVESIADGPARAMSLADAFEGVAGRMPLYSTYADAFRELSSRLEIALPADPSRRAEWIDRLFTPLSARLIEQVRADGLDLARAADQAVVLGPKPKARIADVFQSAARGFRSASARR